MQPTLKIFLLIASMIGAAQSQNWTGTYTVNSGCSTASCCCLCGQVVVTSSSTYYYTVTSPVSGVCGGATTSSGSFYAIGYTGLATILGNSLSLTLSSNSQTITATNLNYASCSGSATKSGTATVGCTSGAIKQHANIIMLFAIALVGMAMSASKM
jgi:hypothetical protein